MCEIVCDRGREIEFERERREIENEIEKANEIEREIEKANEIEREVIYLHGLQILDDLGLVEGLDAGEHAGLADGGSLF